MPVLFVDGRFWMIVVYRLHDQVLVFLVENFLCRPLCPSAWIEGEGEVLASFQEKQACDPLPFVSVAESHNSASGKFIGSAIGNAIGNTIGNGIGNAAGNRIGNVFMKRGGQATAWQVV